MQHHILSVKKCKYFEFPYSLCQNLAVFNY